jgi:hypothetical protein
MARFLRARDHVDRRAKALTAVMVVPLKLIAPPREVHSASLGAEIRPLAMLKATLATRLYFPSCTFV